MGLVSLPVCLGLKELDKGSTLNRVMTLEIHCHGGGGGRPRGGSLPLDQSAQLPSLRCAGPHVPPGQLSGSLACQEEIGDPKGSSGKNMGEARTAF